MEFFDCIFTAFPHIGQHIFKYVDFWPLIRARKVSHTWKDFIDTELSHHIRSVLTKLFLDSFHPEDLNADWAPVFRDLVQKRVQKDIDQFTKELIKVSLNTFYPVTGLDEEWLEIFKDLIT